MNVMRWSSGVLVIILWTGGINALQPVCTPDESTNPYCVCHFDNGSVIDLRSISRKNRPRFSNIKGTDDATTFSYDPCYPFNTRHGCVNATICKQVSGKADTTVNNYNPEGSSFVVESSNQLYIKYIDGETTEIQSKVTLRCDNTSSSPNMVIDNGYLDDTGQNFILTSKCSCADGCKSEPRRNHKSSIDPGYIGIGVLSGLVAVIILYFIIGALIMKYNYKATGSDIIPNKKFWISLPFLVKDGVVFTCSPCVHCSQRKEYESLNEVLKQEKY